MSEAQGIMFNAWTVEDIDELRELISKCEGHHIQQVVYSTYHDGMTQICFSCRAINTTVVQFLQDHIGDSNEKVSND